MALAAPAAHRAAAGICVLWALLLLAGCEGAFGTSPPHAAPSNPSAEGREGSVELRWGAVTDATGYVILWDSNEGPATFDNEITGIEDTTFVHTGLKNLRRYRYRIVATTSGGRGPESNAVTAIPGPVPGAIEWTVVTAQNPGHTIYFPPAPGATHYRVYVGAIEAQVLGRRPDTLFEEVEAPPYVRKLIPLTTAAYYRVVPMNDTRVGVGGPATASPARILTEHEIGAAGLAGTAFGLVNDDVCLDLPTALGGVNAGLCTGGLSARELDEVGLEDLTASPRQVSDVRFADFDGDGFDDIFSNVAAPATDTDSIALLHMNQGDGEFTTSGAVSNLGIGGFGGTILAADFDNDGDIDVFAPHDQSQGDGARNWLLVNDGQGAFEDAAVAAGVDTNPAGDAYVPRGGQGVDFDEDGDVDLLFGSRLLLNNGDGTFSDGSAAANVPVLADHGLKLIDVDLDGDLDLVHRTSSDTRLYRNAGGIFDGGELIDGGHAPAEGFGLNACDLNGDGFEDVIYAANGVNTGRGTPRTLVNVVGELLPSAVQRGIPSDDNRFVSPNYAVACGDAGNDGLIDFVSRWGDDGMVRQMRGSTPLSRRIRLRIVGADGQRNQQGRVLRVVPEDFPERVMTRVVESGSGLRSQNMYDLLVGTPWPGDYTVTVRFAGGDVTATLESGDAKVISEDGTVEDIDPEPEE